MHAEELKNDQEWEDFVQTIPEATFYHTIKWKRIIEKSFRVPPAYLIIRDRGKIVGVCPGFVTALWGLKIYSSLPKSDYGGPLFNSTYSVKATRFLRNFLKGYCSEKDISYVKLCFLGNMPEQFSEEPFTRIDRGKGIAEIDLKETPSEFIWKKVLSKKDRNKIRRFEKDGFRFEGIKSKSGLKEFYSLYHSNMMYIRASAYPYRFFENLWGMLPTEEFRVWLVTGERSLGGIGCFVYHQRLYVTYAAINRELNLSKYALVPYMLWNLIRWSEEHGVRYSSIGSTPSDPTHPYHHQKLGFGAKFLQQETALIPFSYNAKAFLIVRGRAISAWKAVRDLLPRNFKTSLERRLFQL
jgi:hypothetical protein